LHKPDYKASEASRRIRNTWNDVAGVWDEFIEGGLDYSRLQVHGPALLRACGSVRGLRVLDLGCGQGFFSRRLARRGAKVTGVDIAEKMVDLAQAHEKKHALGIQYRVMDAATVNEAWPRGAFELAVACMSLHDMADPEAVLRASHRVLAKDGRMAFSIVHPTNSTAFREWETNEKGEYLALKIDHYFEKGEYAVPWTMQRLRHHWSTSSYRFTLADWSAMIEHAGFVIQRIYEPRPTRAQVAQHPENDVAFRLPFFLVFSLVKG